MSPTMGASRRWWRLLVLVLVSVVVAALWREAHARRVRVLRRAEAPKVYGTVPEAVLTDQQGRTVRLSALHGTPWIASFIFTRCAGQCPMIAARMAELQRRLPAEPLTRLVSFTMDPVYDTPERLREYGMRYGADERWLFLAAPAGTIFTISRQGFKLGAEPQGGTPAEPILHSVRLVLVDAEGRIRGYYDSTEPGVVDRLLQDVAALR